LRRNAAAGGGWIAQCLGDTALPTVAASDYVSALPELIRAWVNGPYTCLGTDGFGRSDTRAALRDYFQVDSAAIVRAALAASA
ncbi:MAG: hypothetical protein Q8K85_08950, partial [Hyphomicrobium sp.]|nr:hypothetical protein [Hyphomicrobium sp.]